MEQRSPLDDIRVLEEPHAPLGEGLFNLLDLTGGQTDEGFVKQRPQALSGLEFWSRGRQEEQLYTFGNIELFARVPSRPVEHEQDASIRSQAQ